MGWSDGGVLAEGMLADLIMVNTRRAHLALRTPHERDARALGVGRAAGEAMGPAPRRPPERFMDGPLTACGVGVLSVRH